MAAASADREGMPDERQGALRAGLDAADDGLAIRIQQLVPHVGTIVDREGNVVSNTYTLNDSYGSGVTARAAMWCSQPISSPVALPSSLPSLPSVVTTRRSVLGAGMTLALGPVLDVGAGSGILALAADLVDRIRAIGQYLPDVVNQMTPDGRLPSEEEFRL